MQDAPYRTIPASSSEGTVYALVDAEDFQRFGAFRWHISNGYVTRHEPMRNGRRGKVVLHRAILGLKRGDGLEGDHINRDRLDNRRENLRVVTRAVNGRNIPGHKGTSRYRGVSWNTHGGIWHGKAVFEAQNYHLGSFVEENDAARAVNEFWARRGYAEPNKISSASA